MLSLLSRIQCSRFSTRYQTLKKLQNDFKLLFIFDGIDEAGGFRENVESYINEKLKSRGQMVIVTSRQPAVMSLNFALYRWLGVLPLTEEQQLEYARRKLENNSEGNSHFANMRLLEATESVLVDPKYCKLTSNPLMLSYITALIDSDTKGDSTSGGGAVRLGGSSGIGSGLGGGIAGEVLGVGLEGTKAQRVELMYDLPFKDKPAMFYLAVKLSIARMDIASGVGESKVEGKQIMDFLQRLAYFCHCNISVDITAGQVVELLQTTSTLDANAKEHLESSHLIRGFRHIWNHVTTSLKLEGKRFELMTSTSCLVKMAGGTMTQCESVYQFSHISFQEYLCARQLLDKLQAEVDHNVSGIEACNRVFLNNPDVKGGGIMHNFWWTNVVYFAANAAPSWLFKDMAKFMLNNDDDSASNATLCFDLAKLRGEPMTIPRLRATARLTRLLVHHSVDIRRLALGEIQMSNSSKVDCIGTLVKMLVDDNKEKTASKKMFWYEKIAAVNSLVCMDAALFCVGSNRTMHTNIVQCLCLLLSDSSEAETVKSVVLESIRAMGLQVRGTRQPANFVTASYAIEAQR